MILAITFIVNILLTALFIYIANKCYKKDKLKAISFCRFSLGFKVAVYIPCVFAFSYFLNLINVPKFLSILPILYIIFLVILDASLFFRTIRKIRCITISFADYLRATLLDVIMIMLPAFCVIVSRAFLDNSDFIFYCLLVVLILGYNFLYPILMNLKYKGVRQQLEELETFRNNIKTKKYIFYVYNGTVIKEANVLICGIIPPYSLFISDYLISQTTPQELDAIIYHEMGHIKKAHLLIRNIFLLSCYPLLVGVGIIMDNYLSDINILAGILVMIIIMVLYGGVLFLFISRRQEYQADEYAVKKCKDKQIYISALKKLQSSNQFLSRKTSARDLFSTHPTIEKRINRINKYF